MLQILPSLLRNDKFSRDVAELLNVYLDEIGEMYSNLFLMRNLDKFNDSVLDEIAKDRSIVWYDSLLPTDRKRDMIKNYRLVYRTLGSEKAVLQLVQDYFGSSGSVTNWHTYDGAHHRFKITINNLYFATEYLYRFLDSLQWVKSADTWLDELIINRRSTQSMFVNMATNKILEGRIDIKPKKEDFVEYFSFIGFATNKTSKIKIDIKPEKEDFLESSFFTALAVNCIKSAKINTDPDKDTCVGYNLGLGVKRTKYIKIEIKGV